MSTRTDLDHVRELIALATGDEKHAESSTSTLDALWVLYERVLRVDPAAPRDEARDRFILSKATRRARTTRRSPPRGSSPNTSCPISSSGATPRLAPGPEPGRHPREHRRAVRLRDRGRDAPLAGRRRGRAHRSEHRRARAGL